MNFRRDRDDSYMMMLYSMTRVHTQCEVCTCYPVLEFSPKLVSFGPKFGAGTSSRRYFMSGFSLLEHPASLHLEKIWSLVSGW